MDVESFLLPVAFLNLTLTPLSCADLDELEKKLGNLHGEVSEPEEQETSKPVSAKKQRVQLNKSILNSANVSKKISKAKRTSEETTLKSPSAGKSFFIDDDFGDDDDEELPDLTGEETKFLDKSAKTLPPPATTKKTIVQVSKRDRFLSRNIQEESDTEQEEQVPGPKRKAGPKSKTQVISKKSNHAKLVDNTIAEEGEADGSENENTRMREGVGKKNVSNIRKTEVLKENNDEDNENINNAILINKQNRKSSELSSKNSNLKGKIKGDSPGSPQKKKFKKITDKKGNVRLVPRNPDEAKSPKGSVIKKKAEPQDYMKILEQAKLNVDNSVQKVKKNTKSLSNPKIVLKKLKPDKLDEVKDLKSPVEKHKDFDNKEQKSKNNKDQTKESAKVATKPESQVTGKEQNSMKSPTFPRKQKIFAAALDVPYETLQKPKFVKKVQPAESDGLKSPKSVRENKHGQSNLPSKIKLEKTGIKLAKVSKVDKSSDSKKSGKIQSEKSPKKIKNENSSPKKYREEFSDEDEELDDNEEFAPIPVITEDNVRRSKRAPKKKTFGDEMIMFDEDGGLTDEVASSEDTGESDDENDASAKESEEEENTSPKRTRHISNESVDSVISKKRDDNVIEQEEVVDDLYEPEFVQRQEDEEVSYY